MCFVVMAAMILMIRMRPDCFHLAIVQVVQVGRCDPFCVKVVIDQVVKSDVVESGSTKCHNAAAPGKVPRPAEAVNRLRRILVKRV